MEETEDIHAVQIGSQIERKAENCVVSGKQETDENEESDEDLCFVITRVRHILNEIFNAPIIQRPTGLHNRNTVRFLSSFIKPQTEYSMSIRWNNSVNDLTDEKIRATD